LSRIRISTLFAEVFCGRAEDRLKGLVSPLRLALSDGAEAARNPVEQRSRNLLWVQFDRARVGIEVALERGVKARLLRPRPEALSSRLFS
jgi:hypothetical protein